MKNFIFIFILFFCGNVISKEKKELKVIKLATVDYLPYYGKDVKDNGPFSEITREAFKNAGYKLELHFIPWARALKMAKKGKIYQGLLGAWDNEERRKDFLYTNEILPSDIHFLTTEKLKDFKFTSLKDFKGYKIGVIRGYSYYKEFYENEQLRKIVLNNEVDLINALKTHKVDFIIDSKLILLGLIKDNYPEEKSNFHLIYPPAAKQPLYNTISKKYPNAEIIIKEFNQSLEDLKKDGEIEKILKNFGL